MSLEHVSVHSHRGDRRCVAQPHSNGRYVRAIGKEGRSHRVPQVVEAYLRATGLLRKPAEFGRYYVRISRCRAGRIPGQEKPFWSIFSPAALAQPLTAYSVLVEDSNGHFVDGEPSSTRESWSAP